MGDNMSEMDVVEAFLSQEPAEGSPVATDGERLCINAEVIAEWFEAGIIVTPVKQGQLHEQLKDRLVHSCPAAHGRSTTGRRVPADDGGRRRCVNSSIATGGLSRGRRRKGPRRAAVGNWSDTAR